MAITAMVGMGILTTAEAAALAASIAAAEAAAAAAAGSVAAGAGTAAAAAAPALAATAAPAASAGLTAAEMAAVAPEVMGSGAEAMATGAPLATGQGAAGATSWLDAAMAPGGSINQMAEGAKGFFGDTFQKPETAKDYMKLTQQGKSLLDMAGGGGGGPTSVPPPMRAPQGSAIPMSSAADLQQLVLQQPGPGGGRSRGGLDPRLLEQLMRMSRGG